MAVTHSTIVLAGDRGRGTTSCMLFDQDKSGMWQNGRRALDIGQEVHDVLVSEAPLRGQASCRAKHLVQSQRLRLQNATMHSLLMYARFDL